MALNTFKKSVFLLPLLASVAGSTMLHASTLERIKGVFKAEHPSTITAPFQNESLDLATLTSGGLQAAFVAAAQHDPELRAAYKTYLADREEVQMAYAPLLPDVSLSANYRYEDSENIYTDPNSIQHATTPERATGHIAQTTWRLSLRQPLYDKGRYENYKSTLSYVDQAEFRYLRAEQELIHRVAERYLAVLLSSQQVYLNQQKLEALELKLAQVQREVTLGVGDQLNLLEVSARRDLARADLLQAKSALIDEQTRLQNITGQSVQLPEAWVQAGYQVTPQLLAGSELEWLERASSNLMYREAEARIRESQLALKSRKAGHYPTVSLNISYADIDSDITVDTSKDLVTSIEMNLPLYQGGRTEAAIRQSSARLGSEQAQSEKVLADAQQQVRLAYSRLQGFKERLEALSQSSESSHRYLVAAERGQKLNLRSQVEVLDARTRLVDTQLRFAETLNEYLLADVRLHFESGALTAQRLSEYDALFNNAVQAGGVQAEDSPQASESLPSQVTTQ